MSRYKLHRTNILFPKTSFGIGIGSALNVFGNYYKINSSKTGVIADNKAIYSDWAVTGDDLRDAALHRRRKKKQKV